MFYRVKTVILPILALAALTLTLQACGGGSSGTTNTNNNNNEEDVAAPTVKSASVDGGGLVDFTKNISIVFSENITAVDGDVLLHQGPMNARVLVTISIAVSNAILTITANPPLIAETDYHLVLKSSIKDSAGNPFAGSNYSFTTAATGGGPVNGPKTITFIELNDLHANLIPHNEMVRQLPPKKKVLVSKRGGLARIATKIDEIRAANPNSILMNIGDTYHGGGEALFSNGNAIVDPVEGLGIDVAVPGNWDFTFSPLVTNARFGTNGYSHPQVKRSASITFLGANAKYKKPTYTTPDFNDTFRGILESEVNIAGTVIDGDFLQPTMVIVKNGVKIGFIGLTSDILEFMHPMISFNIAVTQGLAETAKLVKKHATLLRSPTGGNVDFVVVMSELGIHKDLKLAEQLTADAVATDAVNIIFSAHTHELTQEIILSSTGVRIVEPGNDTYLGQMNVDFDTNNKPTNYQWTLHPITNDIVASSKIASLVTTARAKFLAVNSNDSNTFLGIPQILPKLFDGFPIGGNIGRNFIFPQKLKYSLDQSVGSTPVPINRKHALESTFNNAYTDMLLAQFNTFDIAITPGFRFDSAVFPAANAPDYWEIENTVTLAGDITAADVYRFMPAPYYLASSTITIENLKLNLEKGLETVFSSRTFNHKGGWMFGYAGLNVDVDLTKSTIPRQTPTGKPIFQHVIKITNAKSGVVLFDANLTPKFPTPGLTLTAIGCGRPADLPNLLCSLPDFGPVTKINVPNTMDGYSAGDFLMDNITTLLLNVTTRTSFNDLSATPVWPETEYVQPLRGVGAP